MYQFRNVSLKNKIFFSTLAVILLVSIAIAVLSRWIIVSSLTAEMNIRGISIAHSIGELGSGYILDNDKPNLVNLVFDSSQLGERRELISYIFITDDTGQVLAHTFIHPFPEHLKSANRLPPYLSNSIVQLQVEDEEVYDVAVPVEEGINRIGEVHVGLNKKHIGRIINKLRITFLAFISAIIIIIFWISHALSRYITKPITKLIQMSDEVSRGNLDFKMDLGDVYKVPEVEDSRGDRCPAYRNPDWPCWHVDRALFPVDPETGQAKKPPYCQDCVVKLKSIGDEVVQLTDSFVHMVKSIKLYRNRMRESEEKYRSLFDSGPDPIFVLDARTMEILDANPRAEDIYGYCKMELIGMSFSDLELADNVATLAGFDEIADEDACVFYPKIIHHRKGEVPFYVTMHACKTKYANRNAVIVSTTDITDMVEKDAQLIQASKMTTLGEMSAGMAHELNQPLNAIKMGADFLTLLITNGEQIPPDQLNQISTEISKQVDRATEIINALRAFGRKSEFTRGKIDINKPLTDVLRLIGQQLKLQNIDIELDLDNSLPRIVAQDNRLEQVFFNLITNARDAINLKNGKQGSSADRTISIRSYTENGMVTVAITDSGVGTPENQKDKVFEPFFTTKTTGQGMGLGLSIIYGIVQDYNGQITFESEEGVGTTFKISFPAAN